MLLATSEREYRTRAKRPKYSALSNARMERVGLEPNDPEVRLAAFVIAGLGHVSARSAFFQVQRVPSMDALGRAVRADVIRALKIAAPTLEAFDNVHRQSGRRNRR